MRHLRSILYALVLAPAVWTLSAVGFTQDLAGGARTEGTVEALTGLSLLLLAGAAYAVLLLPRLSPAGPVLAGLIFLAAAGWVLIDPASFDGWWPAKVRKEGFDLTLPGDGVAALLAVPLLCTALLTRRWREPDRPAARSLRTAFGRPVTGSRAGVDATGLGTGDATQPLTVGRSEDATQVISVSRPTGDTSKPQFRTAPAAGSDRVDAADPPLRRSEPAAEAGTATSTPDASSVGAAGTQTPGGGAGEPRAEAVTVATAPDADVTGKQPASRADDADSVADPDGRTVPLDVGPGNDRTQVIPVGLGRSGGGDDERTQVIGVGGVELEGKTQVIVPAGVGERTTGTVTPPAENTQVLGIPVTATPGERTTVRRTPADQPTGDGPARDDDRTVDLTGTDDRPTVDIAARDDRPTAGIPAPRTPHDDEPTTVLQAASSRRDDEPTTDLGGGQGDDRENTRPMTVGGLERPADEVVADTARRTGQTTQRRPAAVPAQPAGGRTPAGVADDGEATRQL